MVTARSARSANRTTQLDGYGATCPLREPNDPIGRLRRDLPAPRTERSNWTVTAHVGGCGARESLAPACVQRRREFIGNVCSAHRPLTRLRLLPGRSVLALLRRLPRLTGVTIRCGLRCLALLGRVTVLTLSVHLAHLPRRARLRCLSIALLAYLTRRARLTRHTHRPRAPA